jgi:HPr kinase/phosphorylase
MIGPTVHASAVLIGPHAALIRGPSGSGKSSLVLGLLDAADRRLLPFARLIGDDRVHLEPAHGRLLVRPAAALAGMLEVRSLGIRTLPHESVGRVGLVIDLAAGDAERLPAQAAAETEIGGVRLPRLAVAATAEPLPLVLAALPANSHAPPHMAARRRAAEINGRAPVYRNAATH